MDPGLAVRLAAQRASTLSRYGLSPKRACLSTSFAQDLQRFH